MSVATKTCAVDGCKRPVNCRGWCKHHYRRWYLYGDTCGVKARATVAERFWAKVDQDGPAPHDSEEARLAFGSCWIWTAFTKPDGYGMFRESSDRLMGAHVWAWESEHGRVPEGLEVDHFVCDRRNCVRPSHLRSATPYDNTMRSPKQLWRRTHCNYGHAFTGENLEIVPRGDGTALTKRRCRTCYEQWRAGSVKREREKRHERRQANGAAAMIAAARVRKCCASLPG